jgi:hypothetical protein
VCWRLKNHSICLFVVIYFSYLISTLLFCCWCRNICVLRVRSVTVWVQQGKVWTLAAAALRAPMAATIGTVWFLLWVGLYMQVLVANDTWTTNWKDWSSLPPKATTVHSGWDLRKIYELSVLSSPATWYYGLDGGLQSNWHLIVG